MNPSTLADIANDGLLGGALVESDSEILATWGDALSRRDRVQFGSVEDMSSWELMASTGLSPGRESGGYVRSPKITTNTTARFSPKPDKPRPLKCRRPQWGTGTDVFGSGYTIWHRCNDCANCTTTALNLKAWRWDVGRGPFQTSIHALGAAQCR